MRHLAALVLLSIAASACANQANAAGPPEIVLGRDLCVECGMLITEERFAAAYRFEGEAYRFDDIGGMLLHGTESGELPAAGDDAWVHDWESRAWMSADTAWYVVAPGLVTPMGYGLVAFADRAAADAYSIERGGEVFSWVELFDFTIEEGRLIHQHGIENEGAAP